MPSTEMSHTGTASPLPSCMDLLMQDSPDSSSSPRGKAPISAERREKVKQQKISTMLSYTQLCVLSDRFQKQKYLSLQQTHFPTS